MKNIYIRFIKRASIATSVLYFVLVATITIGCMMNPTPYDPAWEMGRNGVLALFGGQLFITLITWVLGGFQKIEETA
jgi:hypothetical protein